MRIEKRATRLHLRDIFGNRVLGQNTWSQNQRARTKHYGRVSRQLQFTIAYKRVLIIRETTARSSTEVVSRVRLSEERSNYT